MSPQWQAALWLPAQLPQALPALARHAGFEVPAVALPAPSPGAAGAWMEAASAALGLEAEPIATPVPEVALLLERAAPALLWVHLPEGPRALVLLGAGKGRLRLLSSLEGEVSVPLQAVRDALCRPLEAPLLSEVDALLDAADVPAQRRAQARRTLLQQRLAGRDLSVGWLLRTHAGAPAGTLAQRAGLPQQLSGIVLLMALLYALEIAGWKLVGEAALGGRLDSGWLDGWALLLLTLVPLRWASAAVSARFTLGAARVLKQRLLAGALRLDADVARRAGAGHWLARVIEAQQLESQGLAGVLAAGVGALELAFGAWILSQGAQPVGHLLLLLALVTLAAALAVRYGRELARWTHTRLTLTQQLVEAMVGHRTRLAQEQPERRDAEEDAALHGYLSASQTLDARLLPLVVSLPGAWLVGALALLAPAFAASSRAQLAVSLGGVLFAHRALGGLLGGTHALVRAAAAWQAVKPLWHAGREPAPPRRAAAVPAPSRDVRATTVSQLAQVSAATPAASAVPAVPNALAVPAVPAAAASGPVVDAAGLRFRHAGAPRAALDGADLRIDAGEHVLLTGPSGAGKSTLTALLAGLRQPQSGVLLLEGLDRATLGDRWHRHAAAAPQFHDNHLFSGTLAFNLLMGRAWPPSEADLVEARELCDELGLGPLLQRMPGGLEQRVGETGWQLSHGEQSRVFLARALLQRAPLTVLDESFAALDPPTLQRSLDCARRRSQALLVVAHP